MLHIKHEEAEAGATVLLALLGLLSVYLSRPGEHLLFSRLMYGVRGLAATSGVVAFLSAVVLVVDLSDRDLLRAWDVLAGLAAACAALLSVSWLLASKVPSQRYRLARPVPIPWGDEDDDDE